MADDDATVEQLRAELRELRASHTAEVTTLEEELRTRDRALSETLEHQVATADILRVVAVWAVVERRTIQVADLLTDSEYPVGQQMAASHGHHTTLAVPLLRDAVPIEAMSATRTDLRLFSERKIALLETLADQAVIAIESACLVSALG
jgi:GAF domain-containing protein